MNPASRMIPVLALLALGAPPVSGAAADSEPIPYVIGKDAMFEAGCLPPCMCPVLARAPFSGTFILERGAFDGAFQHYQVRDVSWQVAAGTVSRIIGGGSYKVGGPSGTPQHQLTLDLSVDGADPQRYDGGLVQGGANFPRIELPIALHGFFCHDSVYGVQAHPQVTGVIRTPDRPGLALRASPNPFDAETRIDFAVPLGGRIELRIHDVSGRRVRSLVKEQTFEPGTYAVTWDGRRDDGSRAPAGVYFVTLRAAERETRGRLVRF